MTEVKAIRCANQDCNQEHFSRVRYCPYCGAAQQPLDQTKPPEPVKTVTPPALVINKPVVNPTPTDDEREDEELWEKARALDTIRVYEQYLLTNQPFTKRHIKEAEQCFEQLEKQEKDKDETLWKRACSENTVKAYQGYLGEDLYEKRYKGEAQQKIKALEARSEVSKTESVVDPSETEPEVDPNPIPSNKWWRFALVGAALIFAYVIWANLGGDSKTPGNTNQQIEIAELMRLASDDIRNDRLSNPSGNNALEKYQRILSIQPGHTGALQGIKDIAAHYLDLYKRALAQGDANKARSYLDRAASLDSDIAANRVQYEPVSSVSMQQPDGPQTGANPFEALNAKVTSLRFFEGDINAPPRERRRYGDSFAQSTSRYIYWELNLEHRPPGREVELPITATYWRWDGSVHAQDVTQSRVQEDWITSFHNAGWGGNQPGQWPAGTYELVLSVNGYQIAAGSFRITGTGDMKNSDKAAMCAQFVTNGQEAYRSGQYNQALNLSRRAISTYAQCLGAESLEQQALQAMNTAKEQTDKENQEKARVRCDALVDAGHDALQSASYDQAINSARRAKQAYPQCPGADVLERDALEAKRKAMEGTTIF